MRSNNTYNLENMTTALPFQTEQPAFARMGDLANFANMRLEQQESYMRSLNRYRTVLATKGYEYNRGRAEGRAEGEYQKATTIARNLKSMGMSLDQVAQATGLSPEEINSL